VLIYKPFW